MNDLKELNEILKEPSADEALKSIAKILENENFYDAYNLFTDKAYIESAEFQAKCNRLTTNPALNKALYIYSKEALKHRSGTPYEDMYLFDARTGKVIYKQIDSTVEGSILLTAELEKALKSRNKTMFHTHPASMPPSARDFNAAYEHGFGTCYVFGHNGRIFKYASYEQIDEELFDLCVLDHIDLGYSSFNAQILAIQEFMTDHNIKLGEVTLK